MKVTISSLSIALLALGLGACAAARRQSGDIRPSSSGRPLTEHRSEGMAGSGSPATAFDGDDNGRMRMGRAPRPADMRRIAKLVRRYYAAGAHGNGAAACALTAPAFAATIPADYAQELGVALPPNAEAFLRGAKTCAAVVTLLFDHEHAELATPVDVLGARVAGDYGFALVGSATLPTSLIEVARERGTWRIDGLMGRPLP